MNRCSTINRKDKLRMGDFQAITLLHYKNCMSRNDKPNILKALYFCTQTTSNQWLQELSGYVSKEDISIKSHGFGSQETFDRIQSINSKTFTLYCIWMPTEYLCHASWFRQQLRIC